MKKIIFTISLLLTSFAFSNLLAQGVPSLTIDNTTSFGIQFDLNADLQSNCNNYVERYRAILMDLEPGTMDSYQAIDIDAAATHIFEVVFNTTEGPKTLDLCDSNSQVSWTVHNGSMTATQNGVYVRVSHYLDDLDL